MPEPRGLVSLVGAGPGDPGLLTRRGEAVLRLADVVVYDRLVDPSLLTLAPAGAEKIFVGKEPGRHAMTQDEISALLVRLGRQGRRVVRLKGGDPFVFGRGGEEALALRAAGVPFEIVPGVSSAIAAPAYAGIPVTHRGLATSVTIATGHEDPTRASSSINWQALAHGSDTLVFLMGVEYLREITEHLLKAGRSSQQPAALVRWGTTPRQESLLSTLGEIAAAAEARGIKPPAVLVVGAVAQLASELEWRAGGPLRGRTVLVTRARQQASALSERLAQLGAQPLEFPSIRIEPVEDTGALDQALGRLTDFDWVLFTSTNGVTAAFTRLAALGRDARAFAGTRIAAIGSATAGALQARGLTADFVPSAFTSEAIIAEARAVIAPGARVLLLRTDIAPPALLDGLRAQGALVENVVAYRTVPDLSGRVEVRRLLAERAVNVVTFTSSSTVTNLLAGLGEARAELLAHCFIACIGPVTAATARQAGLRVDLVAPDHTIDGLVAALAEALHRPARTLEATR